jgi:hypothetical protein
MGIADHFPLGFLQTAVTTIRFRACDMVATSGIRALVRTPSLCLLTALIVPSAADGQTASQKACDLLTAAELQAATGGSVAHSSGTEAPYKKNEAIDHDGVLYECSEAVGTWNLSIKYSTSQVTPEARKKGLATAIEMQEAMRKDGYQVQTKNISGSKCSTIVEPASAKHPEATVLVQTACQLEKGPYFVSITVRPTRSRDLFPMEKVAALAEKAALRLPTR